MQITISKDGTQIGPLPEEEVRSKLAAGEFAASDLAWREGSAEWQPLGLLLSGGVFRPVPPSLPPVQGDGTSGMAIGSLICGLFGVFIFPALIAVILGHIALGQIRRAGGALRGRGMAIAGLVLGYCALALIPIAIVASLLVPTFNVIQQMANLTKASNEARQIVIAARTYAADHQGQFPPTLQDLVKSGDLANASFLECSLGKHYPGVTWVYHGAGLKDDAPPRTVILSTSPAVRNQHIEAYLDGSAEIIREKKTGPPAASSR